MAQFCGEFKASFNSAVSVALQLCSPSEADQLRHFGLQTLSDAVCSHWNTADEALKRSMKETSLMLIESVRRPS